MKAEDAKVNGEPQFIYFKDYELGGSIQVFMQKCMSKYDKIEPREYRTLDKEIADILH